MSSTPATDADLAIIVVSTNEARWLDACLSTVFAHAGDARLDVVVVDNESTDGTRELVSARFPQARVVESANKGFAHANNRGAATCSARYVLFLNPDPEIVDGTFGDLVAVLDERPVRGRWAGERELDLERYAGEVDCDWTSGSFMLARREALLGAGLMDERFFIYSEEPDLCLRMKRHGWQVRHLPGMTIIHHAGKGGIRPRMIAQDVFTRRQYARKHFAAPHRAAYLGAVGVRHAVRAVAPGGDTGAERRAAARLALRTLVGQEPPPFGSPPATAIARLQARSPQPR